MQNEDGLKVVRIPIVTPTLWPHTTANCFLIGTGKECFLIDSGYDRFETRMEIDRMLKENNLPQPKSIILTHYHEDHSSGIKQLTDWSTPVYCHVHDRGDIQKIIFPYDKITTIHDGETFTVDGYDILIIHGPGHTTGHLSLYIPSLEILIAGDNLVAEGTTWIGPPEGDMSDYISTLQRLKKFKLKKIGPGHGEWVHNPYEKIDFVLKRRLHREEQIKVLLKEHKQLTSSTLTKMIYENNIHPSIFTVAEKTIEAHLIKLQKEGIVSKENNLFSLI